MQPQDNDFPIDQVQGGGGLASPTDGQSTGQEPIVGGATFQPQSSTSNSSAAPAWQNDAQADANAIYAQPDTTMAGAPQNPPAPTTDSTPPSPSPNDAMQTDFQNAGNLTASNPLLTSDQPEPVAPIPTTPEPQTVAPQASPEPAPMTSPSEQAATGTAMGAPALAPKEPIQYEQPQPADQSPMNQDMYAQPAQPGLPGSDSLGAAVAGMGQAGQDQPQMQTTDQMMPQGQMPQGTYGPPPKKKSGKLLFIILGIVVGLAIIGVGVFLFLRSRTTTTTQTPTTTNQTTNTTNTTTTTTPTSGPATPPPGYATITKQCYTFALFVPNTVPQDQACTFTNSTFGQKQISKIAVSTGTIAFKTIDELTAIFKPTITVVSENKIKLDNFDATQIIYKSPDGKTYSAVFTLVVGKNYQQDGKAVTTLVLTTSYQDDFDTTVTKNVLDTWRWQ